MTKRPVVLLHGYASSPRAFAVWKRILRQAGVRDLRPVHYATLSDEVVLDDLAEGFERALRTQADLQAGRFDLVVHSTGMLVLRAWLAADPVRSARLGRLIALAPATYGSPLAHLGRGMLAALFVGNRALGPDFLETGDRILAALELGSPDAWRLAERDRAKDRAPPLVLCGVGRYPFPLGVGTEPAGDGVVRLAGCNPDDLAVDVDFSARGRGRRSVRHATWGDAPALVVPLLDCHHGTILSDPPAIARKLVIRALAARNADDEAGLARAAEHVRRRALALRDPDRPNRSGLRFAQMIVRVRDERDAPVRDYYADLLIGEGPSGPWKPVESRHPRWRPKVHVHRDDPSLRCFHLDLHAAPLHQKPVALRILAHAGTDLVGYTGHREPLTVRDGRDREVPWDGVIRLNDGTGPAPFQACATTRLSVRLDREPLPLSGPNRLVRVGPPAR